MHTLTMGPALALSMEEYASRLVRNGTAAVPGSTGTFWVRTETGAMIRFPTFNLAPPTPREVQHVLWRGPAAVVSYVLGPDESHPLNTWLYVCQDQSYNIEKLSKAARRDARRALRNLVIAPVEWSVLLDKGSTAFRETIMRIGLSDESPTSFRRHYENFSRNPCHHVVGAWKEDTLVALMTLIVVDDWVEIEGSFFMEAYKGLCPNNGLAHYVLDYFLVQRGFKTVSYGMSSVQEGNGKAGLHAYKTKVGFEARPVHRVFIIHPLLRLFVNRLTLRMINTALRFRPRDRRLKKAEGVLAHMLGEKQMLEMKEKHIPDEQRPLI